MSSQGDPYLTLGVAPGASLNEIKSAYRRLAKKYHPDAAGERALPRFLAIQAAYERLVDGEGRLRPAETDTGARGPGPATCVAGRVARTAVGERRDGPFPGDGQQRTCHRLGGRAGTSRRGRVRRGPPARARGPTRGEVRARPPLGPPPTTRPPRPHSIRNGTVAPGTGRRPAPTGRSTRASTPIPASTARSTSSVPGAPRPAPPPMGPRPRAAPGGAARDPAPGDEPRTPGDDA